MSYRDYTIGLWMAIGITVVLICAVYFGGWTFGARCDKAFPTDPARAELCVYNLSKGNAP